jgi:Ca-activated chloride channel homolog
LSRSAALWRTATFWCIAGTTAALAACVLFAQQPKPALPDSQDVATFSANTSLVVLYASVLERSGKLVTNIPQSAFKVLENGVEQPLKLFRREDVPVSMGILIDNSGSMRNKQAKVAAAALALVKASNPQDEIFLVNFNDEPHLDQDFTNDLTKLEHALSRLESRGSTAMRDAINMSYIKPEPLIRKARQSEVLIYSIGLLNEEEPQDRREAKKALKTLTENSGGVDYYPKDAAEVDKIVPQIARDIRNQYVLGYLPTNTVMDGSFRKISVVVNGYGHPTVRTRNGYYAQSAKPNPPGGK